MHPQIKDRIPVVECAYKINKTSSIEEFRVELSVTKETLNLFSYTLDKMERLLYNKCESIVKLTLYDMYRNCRRSEKKNEKDAS